MAAQVLSFFQRSPRLAPAPSDWSQQELAEFYRVESALIRAGIRVGTDRGMSDENEPWFVFYRADDGEVVIHFARIDGEYLIAGPAYEEIARGFDFSSLVRNMVARHPLVRRPDSGGNLSIHPAALLVAVVGTAFFKTGEARAAESGATNSHSPHAAHARPTLLSSSSSAGLSAGAAPMALPQSGYDTVQVPANQAVLILAAALFASDYAVDSSSLDPAARAAISAAAAALDFGAPASSRPADAEASTLPATHATVVETGPAQTVSSVLSLVALLSTLPHPAETAAASESVLGDAIHTARHASWGAQEAANDAGAWALDIRLDPGLNGLPSVDAVELVLGLAGGNGAQRISVIEVAKLPNVLAELIAKGDHFVVAPTAPGPATGDAGHATPTTPSTPATPAGPGAPSTPEQPHAPIGGTDQIPTTPTTPTPPVDTKPSPPAFASPDLVKEFINYFLAHTTSVEVIAKGSDIVMFDSRVLHEPGAVGHLDSMTFDFADGSSISLVGDHSAFLHDGILV
jgi:hypothetical protein